MPTLTGPIGVDGALVSILIGVSEARRQALRRVGFPVPGPFTLRAVLDTGSFISVGDAGAIGPLGVAPYDQRTLFTSATGLTPHVRDVFDLSITLLDDTGQPLAYWPSVDVLPGVFPPTDVVHGVFGRDVLAATAFLFDGKGGAFTLTV